jgi:hypothetical protein
MLVTVPRRKDETDALVLRGGVGYDLKAEMSGVGDGITEGDCSGDAWSDCGCV